MKIIECPRDAMQGLEDFIPTDKKVAYINQLLKVGFDTIDFGSFVSPKAIPQLRDTAEVVNKLEWQNSTTKLLSIVANTRGAQEASSYDAISYIGFPLSLSETFQKRNTNKSIAEALHTLGEIKDICIRNNKRLVTYISMGFGNPYGDDYNVDLVNNFVDILVKMGSDVISVADTIGVATPESISFLFQSLTNQYTTTAWGAHLHSAPATVFQKIEAAYNAGCKRFDGAIKGYGGCPMAADELVGNMPTEAILSYLNTKGLNLNLDKDAFQNALAMADEIFLKH